MSYILDAIKKSEGERVQSSEPEALSMQAGNAFRVTTRRSRAPWMAAAVAAAFVFAIWLFWPSISGVAEIVRKEINLDTGGSAALSNTAKSNNSQAALDQAGNGDASRVHDIEKSLGDTRQNSAGQAVAGNSVAAVGYAADATLPPTNEIKELWQLPADFQAKIPTMDFSFHVYSQTPHKRTIIINGRRMREGQMVTSKIKLRLITATGIILHAHGRFFHIDVVEKW